MPKLIPLSLVIPLLMLMYASEVFAGSWKLVPLQGRSPSAGRQPAGTLQPVSGVTSRGGAAIPNHMATGQHQMVAAPMPGAMMPAPAPMPPRQYPQMHAPMYPTPVPNVPVQVGGTVYSNQAFAPHEMLYPHEYRALYAPFFYKVSGKWCWTPWGIESHDKWELQGTEVRVKYHDHYSLFSGFCPPASR